MTLSDIRYLLHVVTAILLQTSKTDTIPIQAPMVEATGLTVLLLWIPISMDSNRTKGKGGPTDILKFVEKGINRQRWKICRLEPIPNTAIGAIDIDIDIQIHNTRYQVKVMVCPDVTTFQP